MFEVFQVDPELSDRIEQMGSKPKFWYQDSRLGRALFKKARPGTGEHWAEKVAEQLCSLLGLPHAQYELAVCGTTQGTTSPSFTRINGSTGVLIHGNELLVQVTPSYKEQLQHYSRPGHTLDRILHVISAAKMPVNWTPPSGISTPVEVFVGYLMLDAWICNGDRHDENWGLLIMPGNPPTPWSLHLAPTFDHASSLGRNESDTRRLERLETKDEAQSVAGYAARSRSAIFKSEQDSKPMLTLDCFQESAYLHPYAASVWLDKLEGILKSQIEAILESVPGDFMSNFAKEFALEMLELRRLSLLSVKGSIA